MEEAPDRAAGGGGIESWPVTDSPVWGKGRGPVRVSFMCRSFGNFGIQTVAYRGRGRSGQSAVTSLAFGLEMSERAMLLVLSLVASRDSEPKILSSERGGRVILPRVCASCTEFIPQQ